MNTLSPLKPALVCVPMGLCSSRALHLTYEKNDFATLAYSPELDMTQRLRNTTSLNRTIDREIAFGMEDGFWRRTERRIGPLPNDKLSFVYPSQFTLNYLANLWIYPNMDSLLPMDRNKKENNQIRSSHEELFLELYSDPSHDYTEGSSKSRFLETVKQERLSLYGNERMTKAVRARRRMEMTPLGLYPNLAIAVSLAFGNSSNAALYSRFRQSNIHAMFLANGFLTWLDRRPYTNNWNYLRTLSDDDLNLLPDAESSISLSEYTTFALRNYYTNNPNAYSIQDPFMTKKEWENTPAYYSVRDLPNFNHSLTESFEEMSSKYQMPIKYTFAGVAVSSKAQFIVHHTQRRHTPWYINVEQSTQRAVSKSLVSAGLMSNYHVLIHHAIVIAENVYQLVNFFNDLCLRARAENTSPTQPYDTIHLMLLNHAGVQQLHDLLTYGPELVNDIIADQLIKTDAAYCAAHGLGAGRLRLCENDPIFMLTYTPSAADPSAKLPVFLGHSMELNEINMALKAYSEGRRFLIACYPEQVAVYRKLMPAAEYL